MSLVCQCGHRLEIAADERERLAATGGKFTCPNCGRSGKVTAKKTQQGQERVPERPPPEPDASIAELFGLNVEQDTLPILEPAPPTPTNPLPISRRWEMPRVFARLTWNHWIIGGAALLVLIAIGVSQFESNNNPTAPTETEKAGASDNEQREVSPEFTVLDVRTKSVDYMGVEHRSVVVVFENPETKEQIESACQKLYASYKRDIEAAQPKATHKLLNILVYDSFADARERSGLPICQARGPDLGVGAAPQLPDWEQVKLDWHWRHPEFRPSEEKRAIYREYVRGLFAADKIAHEPFIDKDGIIRVEADDRPVVEARKKVEERKLVERMCLDHKLSQPELAQMIAYVSVWSMGGKPTEDTVDRHAQMELSRWAESSK